MCSIGQSEENYPDVFHLWTAQRNRIDAILALDTKFANIAKQIENSGKIRLEYRTRVMQPIEFLASIGIVGLDPVPIEPDRFYPSIL